MEAALRESEKRLRRYADQLQRMVDKKVRQLEQERTRAIQLDKLAALGQMAAGVAHELNQPLAAIRFEADYLVRMGVQSQVEHGGDLNAMLDPAAVCEIGEEVKEDLDRCRRLIDHLRDFGRISQEPPAPVSLNEPIEDSFILVGARLRSHDVDVQLDLDPDLPPTMAHRYRLEQVFLNLISNAEYAMDQRAAVDPGFQKVLEITTGAVGDDVIATVRDNGCGMPDDVRERIFDPFFTTKPRGEGTGLGLSISYGIVADYDGEITCHSAEGQGTTFTLRFPAADS
jgi:C4-dicarboxylate-specific signal transduction histidine kinase